jgi:putative mRNA 3-end processing factor
MSQLLRMTRAGLFCEAGDFYIDPWRPVHRAVITHAHADHARRGSGEYLTADRGAALTRHRLGDFARVTAVRFGEVLSQHGVKLSFHPAGHVLGSAQIRIEQGGEVWVVSGDYKLDPDPTCAPFEPVRCHTFISEATFGLPVYRWPATTTVIQQMNQWWRQNRADGKVSVVFGYSLGKAQRILASLDSSIGPIMAHGAVTAINEIYRAEGVPIPETIPATNIGRPAEADGALVIVPPSAQSGSWLRRFGHYAAGFVSGWMLLRGTRRRRAVERGFVISDHADWPGLVKAIEATQAERVFVTHGYSSPMARWLKEQGYDADVLETRFAGELESEEEGSPIGG